MAGTTFQAYSALTGTGRRTSRSRNACYRHCFRTSLALNRRSGHVIRRQVLIHRLSCSPNGAWPAEQDRQLPDPLPYKGISHEGISLTALTYRVSAETLLVCGKGKTPLQRALRWAAEVVGSDIESMEPLRAGHSPWRLRFHDRDSDVVLRIVQPGWDNADPIRTNAGALLVAEQYGLAAPRLIAVDPDGDQAGTPATLETFLSGSSALPPRVSPDRLREFGAAIARVHAIPLAPQDDLPRLTRSTGYDHPMVRRWVTLYNASPEEAKSDVIEALGELTGWAPERARQTMDAPPGTALLQLADERIRATPRPEQHSVFLHGDVWGGNSLWDGDTCLALIDWKDAGVGDPGVDLGKLRLQMAMQYGMDAPPYVLEGWERTAGRSATDVAYWDVNAAINMPTVPRGDSGFDPDGNPLDAAAITERRDAFLRAAITALP